MGKDGEGSSRYMYKGLMVMDNMVGIDRGSWGWEGQRRATREKLGQL